MKRCYAVLVHTASGQIIRSFTIEELAVEHPFFFIAISSKPVGGVLPFNDACELWKGEMVLL